MIDPIRNFPIWRRLWEGVERAVTPGNWPAHLATSLGVVSDVAVEHYDIHVAGPLGGTNSLRIAFASDFHAGPITPVHLIDQAIEHLRRAQADVLLFGGDFVSLRGEYARDLASQLAMISAPLGSYAVLGNHDYWADGTQVARHLESAGIKVLTNRNVRLADPFANVSICGLDDHTSGEPDAGAALEVSESIRVVLMHSPSGLLDIGERSFTVALCGHTHGGQIALPNGRALLVAHGKLTRTYNAGRFDLEGNKTLLVSRGIGCSGLPLRFNAPPAVLTCTIHGKQ